MTGVMIFTVIIVFVIYFYMRYTAKRNRTRTADMDSIKTYHDNYKRDRSGRPMRKSNDPYRTFVTKYNSSEDYREPKGLYKQEDKS